MIHRSRLIRTGLAAILLCLAAPLAPDHTVQGQGMDEPRYDSRFVDANGIQGVPTGAEETPWTAEQLRRRAALIYIQHTAFSLNDAGDRNMTPAEQGRRIGEIVARHKERLAWHTSSNALLANALAKLIEDGHALEFGRATFTLRGRYARAARELARYGSSIDEYVRWLQAMHDAIGPVQGYAMTVALEGDWLVETYSDLPARHGLAPATDLPDYAPRVDELRRYEGVYAGTGTEDPADEHIMRVWEEDGRLRVASWRVDLREPYGRHLVPLEPGVFMPGWYSADGTVEVQSNARIRFAPLDSARPERVEVEVSGEQGTLVLALRRVPR